MEDWSRTELHLAVVHHRDKTLKRAFRDGVRAREWVARRRAMAPIVQWSVEVLWLCE